MESIVFTREIQLSAEEFKSVLEDSGLGERRPIDDWNRLTEMLKNANLIVTARKQGKLIGVARCLSDFSYATYLSDLAVSSEFQKKRIGKALLEKIKEYAPQAKIIILAAPSAVTYYPHLGLQKHDHCFIIP